MDLTLCIEQLTTLLRRLVGHGQRHATANVRDMVTGHGGCIDVESAEGHGATFRVYFRRSMPSARRT